MSDVAFLALVVAAAATLLAILAWVAVCVLHRVVQHLLEDGVRAWNEVSTAHATCREAVQQCNVLADRCVALEVQLRRERDQVWNGIQGTARHDA